MVFLGPRNGYYVVRPDSRLFSQLGLYEAPVIDTASWLRHGYGADALAFRFNRNGVLIAPPAYITQEAPNDFYTRRIGSLPRGGATVHDVELSLAAATLAQIGRMVLCGTTRCRFIIHLNIKATSDLALAYCSCFPKFVGARTDSASTPR